MNKNLLPNEKIALAILTAGFLGFGIYTHMASPSDKFNEIVLTFLKKLDLAFFVAPFSVYLLIKAQKSVSANESVIESIKGFMLAIFGVVLALSAIYIRLYLAR